MELHVLLSNSRLPQIAQWQATIDALGFDLKLDAETIVDTQSGFLPARLKGRESGFEFSVWKKTDITEAYPDFAARFAAFDTTANFRWGGDLDEMACALVAAAALTHLCGGLWFDPQESECRDAAGAIAEARAGVQAVE